MKKKAYKKGIEIIEYEKKDFAIPRDQRIKNGIFSDFIDGLIKVIKSNRKKKPTPSWGP